MNGHHHPSQRPPSSGPAHHVFLIDLIESEKYYTNDLFTIIKRIASAYSPQNFPPPHLDHHFRLIETIFRTHKSFVASLLSLDPAPASFDLSSLIRLLLDWLANLYPVYHHYCSPTGWAGAGGWSADPTLLANDHLQRTLASLPWPGSLPSPPAEIFPGAPYRPEDLASYDSSGQPHASLTVFFALPFSRLVYYRRLFQRVLQLTPPTAPDHRPIADGAAQLSILLDRGCEQWQVSPLRLTMINSNSQPPSSTTATGLPASALARQQSSSPQNHHRPGSYPVPVPVPDRPASASQPGHRTQSRQLPLPPVHTPPVTALRRVELTDQPISPTPPTNARVSIGTSNSGLANSSVASTVDGEVFDRTTPSTPLSGSSRGSEGQMSNSKQMVEVRPGIYVQQYILDLQRLMDTSRCLDIFTMTPNQCRLHMAPPNLAHSRTLRISVDASFKIRPQSDPSREIETQAGRLILITDLLMFCEYRNPGSDRRPSTDSAALLPGLLSLMYPPLAGKHLKVALSPVDEKELEVVIMRKEVVKITVASRAERDQCVQAIEEAVDYGCNQIPTAKPLTVSSATDGPLSSIISAPVVMTTPSTLIRQSGAVSRSTSPVSAVPSMGSLDPPQLDPHDQRSSCSAPYPRSMTAGGPLKIRTQAPTDRLSQTQPHTPCSAHEANFQTKSPLSASPIRTGNEPGGVGSGHSALPPHHEAHNRPPRPQAKPIGMPVAGRPGPTLRKAPSAHSLGSQTAGGMDTWRNYPPMPNAARLSPVEQPVGNGWEGWPPRPGGEGLLTTQGIMMIPRPASAEPLHDRHQYRPPSAMVSARSNEASPIHANRPVTYNPSIRDLVDDEESLTDVNDDQVVTESVLVASMKTKVYLKQSHSQWKSIGTAKLQLFVQRPRNWKQLVVCDEKGKTLISTIVITDGVERVGRTGVAVDLGDKGVRTGIVYMLQMKNENSASGLFEQLLAGSDRRPNQC